MHRPNWRTIAAALLVCLCFTTARAQQPLTLEQYTADFDAMWTGLRDGYCYFERKQTDWNRVRAHYRPMLAEVKSRSDFVTLLERVLDELYDNHTSLNTNLQSSPRLVPTGLDVWAEWRDGRAVVTQLRRGFSAEQAGLEVGMEIVAIDGVPVEQAVSRRLPISLKSVDAHARNWALRAVLAGTHDRPRTVTVKGRTGAPSTYRLDLPSHMTVDRYEYEPRVEWKMLPREIGYIKINDLVSSGIVPQFDAALEKVKGSRGLILDLRDIPGGGNTGVAEPILGRFVAERRGYQQVVPLHEPLYTKEVVPRNVWTYRAPLVVLVNRWTASMGEGMAIGLHGMRRATIVGTRMAGLNGGIFNLELEHTRIGVSYAGERLNHIDGTPREDFVPPVLVDLSDPKYSRSNDPILEAGHTYLVEALDADATPDRSVTPRTTRR